MGRWVILGSSVSGRGLTHLFGSVVAPWLAGAGFAFTRYLTLCLCLLEKVVSSECFFGCSIPLNIWA
jgi:hypothetical protein